MDVTVLARNDRFDFIKKNGIVLKDYATEAQRSVAIKVIDELRSDDRYDLIMVIMRKNQVGSILPSLAGNQSPNVIFMCNSASGPKQIVAAIGEERTVLGFVAAGGRREDQVVTYLSVEKSQPTTIGEITGKITPRLEEIGALLKQGGFAVRYETKIDDWLRSHVALVAPIAMAVYAAGGSTRKIVENPKVFRLMLGSIKEGLNGLATAGFTILPSKFGLARYVPVSLLAIFLRSTFANPASEVVMAAHANSAKDEMHHLYNELRETLAGTAARTTAIDELAEMAWRT